MLNRITVDFTSSFVIDIFSAQSGLALQVGVYSTDPSASGSSLASLTQLSENLASLK